jgi:YHS domain-containing protein
MDVMRRQSLCTLQENEGKEELTMAECPVCSSQVRDDVPTADSEHDGETYYFESAKCKELFDADPSEYT